MQMMPMTSWVHGLAKAELLDSAGAAAIGFPPRLTRSKKLCPAPDVLAGFVAYWCMVYHKPQDGIGRNVRGGLEDWHLRSRSDRRLPRRPAVAGRRGGQPRGSRRSSCRHPVSWAQAPDRK